YLFVMGVAFRRWQVGSWDDVIPPSCPTFPDRMSYFRTEWVVLLKYIKLFFNPTDLAVEQNFPGIDFAKNPLSVIHTEVRPFLLLTALLAHGLAMLLAVYWWFTKRRF